MTRPAATLITLGLVGMLTACGEPVPLTPEDLALRDTAEAACRAQLALRTGVNSMFVQPLSGARTLSGWETFFIINGKEWLCTTDERGNVNGLEPWGV